MALDLSLLRALAALAEHGTVTGAAQALGLTQSTLSHALARLRAHYGDALFVRSGNRLTPTPLATELAAQARSILGEVAALERLSTGFDPASSGRVFRVHMLDATETVLLPGLLADLAHEAPSIRLDVIRASPFTIGNELENGDLDLAIGTPWGAEKASHQARLTHQRIVGIARAGHPNLHAVRGGDYAGISFCAVRSSGPIRTALESALSGLVTNRRIAVEVPGLLSIPAIVAATDLIAAVPECVVPAAGVAPLEVFRFPMKASTFVVMQHWHKRLHRDPANAWLRTAVKRASDRSPWHLREDPPTG
ncbi:MAG TPA: LysR family transcriptional regulator [Burkholderiaceae bacterium]|nr:LysR family transcriptional regulator [Burkholderiaceae bacterium]